ncbi:MAG: DMT family transporter [Calditrichia bacterium]
MRQMGGKYPLLLILMTVLFGLSFIASKNALQELGIFQVIFGRYLIALLVLTLVTWKNREKFYIARKDRGAFLVLTLVEPVGYFIFETLGVQYTTPSNVSLVIATIPVFTLIFAAALIGEKGGRLSVIGVLLSLAGVYLIVSVQESSELAPQPLLGNLFTFGAAISAGLYNVLCRRLSRTYSPLTITFYQSIVATVVFLPMAAVETFLRHSFTLNGFVVGNLLYLGVGSSVGAYFLLNYTLSRLPSYKVAVFANLVPVVTILASYAFYGDLLRPMQFAGAALVITGIYLTNARRLQRNAAS